MSSAGVIIAGAAETDEIGRLPGHSPLGLHIEPPANTEAPYFVEEVRRQLEKEYGVETDYLRIRAFPFTKDVHDFVAAHERVYVIEQNRDAQMLSLLKLDLPAEETPKLELAVSSG